MTGSSHQDRFARLLAAARELTGSERDAFVESAAGDEPHLLGALRARLARGDVGRRDDPTTLFEDPISPAPRQEAPGRIGPYQVVRLLGEGGMGSVFLAEQIEPIRRQVALKLIKLGMDTRQVLARFEAERQTLALMNHPNVARVFDAGTGERGRPYFVMEYVDGEPITAYCDRERLSLRERVALFRRVCAGVQHAHQKGVIHRDIKASNVLMQTEDGVAVPKIIDFGLAKAVRGDGSERTMLTRTGQILGTPAYMSPEQATEDGGDVDTRSDVYSLGVLLYELLVGALPFAADDDVPSSASEMRRRILEDEPSKPSTRVSKLGAGSAECAMRRRTDAASLRRDLSGDLDWIVLQAPEKDRSRRYQSPSALAADLGRYLDSEPVLARPPSIAYSARRFARRHRTGVTAAVLVTAVFLVGVGGTVWGLARSLAAESEARREAEARAEVARFLQDVFVASDPREAQGQEITARELLERAGERIEALDTDPATKATLMATIGEVHAGLGDYDSAEHLLRRAVDSRRSELGSDHSLTLDAEQALADALHLQGKYDEAEDTLRRIVARRRASLGGEHPSTIAALADLGLLLRNMDRLAEAEELLTPTLTAARRHLGDDHPTTLRLMHFLANVFRNDGRSKLAVGLYGEALDGRERLLGPEHPDTLFTMTSLASALSAAGQYEEAEILARRALGTRQDVLGHDHPFTLSTKGILATVLTNAGRYDEARRLLEELIPDQERVFGRRHSDTLRSKERLALIERAAH